MAEESKGPDGGSEKKEEEGKGKDAEQGMTMEEAHAALKTIMPMIAKLQKLVGSGGSEKEAVTDAEEKKEEKGEGMDAAAVQREVDRQLAAREQAKADKAALYDPLSQHIGAFDHAEMDIEKMASYGCEKLGIKAPAGQSVGFLRGYLAANGTPKKTDALDAAPRSGNFVDRYLKQE
jgi:hypothetical protein